MRSILPLTCLLLSWRWVSVQTARPAPLPPDNRLRLAALREFFRAHFEAEYPARISSGDKQFMVMTVGDTGFTGDHPFFACSDGNDIFATPQPADAMYVARTWINNPQLGFEEDISEQLGEFVSYFAVNRASTENPVVHIFTYNLPCMLEYTNKILDLARGFPSLTFYVGYEVALSEYSHLAEQALDVLSLGTNIYAGNVRGSVQFQVHRPSGACWFDVVGDGRQHLTLYAANRRLWRGHLPQIPTDPWLHQATPIGSGGPDWDSFQFLLFSPNRQLCGMHQGQIYAGEPPANDTVNWLSTADPVSNDPHYWSFIRHLLFHPGGDVYWVLNKPGDMDALFKWGNLNVDSTTFARLGASGWADFKVLLFDPVTGDLYGVVGDQLFAAPPPTQPSRWTSESAWLGTRSWALFRHMFFDPHGILYAVDARGQLLVGPPPEYPTDCWNCRAQVIGQSGWLNFSFLFFDPLSGAV